MWSHYCKAEKHSMYVEDDKECNWCGKTQPDNQGEIMNEDSISNVEITDNPDGSASVKMDIDPETQQILMKQGLQYLIEEMKMNDKVTVMEPNEFHNDTKTWDLSDDDANALFHFGFISAIKLGLEK